MAQKKDFTGVKDQLKKSAGTTATPNLAEEEPKKTTKKKADAPTKHINVALSEDHIRFLKALGKIRGESYSETISAMIDRAQRENSELVALVEKARAAL